MIQLDTHEIKALLLCIVMVREYDHIKTGAHLTDESKTVLNGIEYKLKRMKQEAETK